MNTTDDPIDVLRRLKPAPALDPAALDRLLAEAAHTPPAKRRATTKIALTAGLLVSGVAVAGATGMLPHAFTDSLSFWHSETRGGVSAGNGHRVAQQPGPGGRVLTVWSATAADGTTCVSALYETAGPLDRPAPADFHSAGGQCTPATGPAEPFGNTGGSSEPDGVHTMWVSAGDAVTAELKLADGTTRPALAAAGLFFCWYTAGPSDEPPVLVGHDKRGRKTGSIPMPNLSRPR
ncbi:hypothetical protein AB0M02_43580 [Actinoplanes sp. NPDC051861]|uniref:hypothetical protein n=1 Tax=Actinoplanes sp. NPDC051861 TaxID=3155170 RepID=UPI00344164AE